MSASDNNNTDITIPCEICNRQVLFEDYLRHSQRCLEVRETRNRMYLNTINRMRERDILNAQNSQNSQNLQNINNNINRNLNNFINTSLDYSSVRNNNNDIVDMDISENEEENDNQHGDDVNYGDDIETVVSETVVSETVVSETVVSETVVSETVVSETDVSETSEDDIPELIDEEEYDNQTPYHLNFYDSLNDILNNNIRFVNIIEGNLRNDDGIGEQLNELDQYINQENLSITQLIDESDNTTLLNTISNLATQFFNTRNKNIIDIGKICIDLKVEEIDNEECPICYDNMNNLVENNKPVKILCNHKFCKNCVSKWFCKNEECPLCKKNMNECLQNINNDKNEIRNNTDEIVDNIIDEISSDNINEISNNNINNNINLDENNGLPID